MKRSLGFIVSGLLCGCGSSSPADTGTGTSDTEDAETHTSESETGEDTGDTDGMMDVGMEVDELELVRAEFTIPAGTTVQEFDFEAEGVAPPFDTTGGLIAVSVLDLTHPDREQSELCPGSHPLDGCATIDYGAFGMTHDNRMLVERAGGGAAELHLYKDRGVESMAEPLPPSE